MGQVAIYKLWELSLLRPFINTIEKILVTEQEYENLKFLGESQLLDIGEIEDLVKSKHIEIIQGPNKDEVARVRKLGIEGGEMEAVAMYKGVKARFIISEDDYMRIHSKKLGISILSLPDVIWYMVRKRAIPKKKAEEALDRLRKEGWYAAEVIEYVKQNLNGKISPFTGKQRDKFLRLAEQYDKLEISLSSAASQLRITPLEFIHHFLSTGRTLKYSVGDFRNSQRRLYSFLGEDYPPKK